MHQTQVVQVAVILAVLCVCHVTGLPYSSRMKRINSDQRMAELQALMSLAYQPQAAVGHGIIDSFDAGKKKRSDIEEPDEEALMDILTKIANYINSDNS